MGLLLAPLFAAEMALPLLERSSLSPDPGTAIRAIFLGPSTLLSPRSPLALLTRAPLPGWLPTTFEGALACLAAAVAFRRARPLRPEGDLARAWDRVGLRFLFVGVLQGFFLALGVLVARLVGESSP
jgi:hypothetical protein